MTDIQFLYIDLFCGAGGTSTGIEAAQTEFGQCAKVIACVNHDANAIASHAANHPDALHFTEDIRTLDVTDIWECIKMNKIQYPNAKVVLWASLECTNFSKAKGGLPRDADSRTLAEHLFRYIHMLEPDYIQIENVEEFMSWGDLDKKGKPISKTNGKNYRKWVSDVKTYGYEYDYRILNSADYGAYTARKRYFGMFAKAGYPIVFPEPTHSKDGNQELFGSRLKWKPVKDCLDFSDEGNSIFGRKKPLVEATLLRIQAGLIKFVAGGKDKWLLKYNSVNQNTKKHNPPGVDDPCPVVSCQSRLGLVQTTAAKEYLIQYNQRADRVKSINDPCNTVTTCNRFGLVQTSFLSKYFSGNPYSKNVSIEGPAGTITTRDHHSIISTNFLQTYYGNGSVHSLEVPSPTVTTKDRLALLATHYLMNPQYTSAGGDINKPCFTLIARMDKMPPYLIEASTSHHDIPSFIKIVGDTVVYEIYKDDSETMKEIKEFMAIYGIIDIKMRMLRIPELKMIMGFPKDYVLIGTQADQKKFIGNAVEVNIARAKCEALANVWLKIKKQIA